MDRCEGTRVRKRLKRGQIERWGQGDRVFLGGQALPCNSGAAPRYPARSRAAALAILSTWRRERRQRTWMGCSVRWFAGSAMERIRARHGFSATTDSPDRSADEIGGHYGANCQAGHIVPGDAFITAAGEGAREYALDPHDAEVLWKKSEELVGEAFRVSREDTRGITG